MERHQRSRRKCLVHTTNDRTNLKRNHATSTIRLIGQRHRLLVGHLNANEVQSIPIYIARSSANPTK